MKTQQDKIDRILLSMLKEKTGAAICDSGDAYGRHWERNQSLQLKKLLDSLSVEFDNKCGTYTISLFHYLRTQLDIDETCEKFNRINVPAKNWDSDAFYGLSTEGEDFLSQINAKIGGAWNSYNGETNLSQVIQGAYIDINEARYVLLQIHQGCDVRGGYTDARLFKISNEYEDFLSPEDVYGVITKQGGIKIQVDNRYNGYSLTDENGNEVEILESDKVDLWLSE